MEADAQYTRAARRCGTDERENAPSDALKATTAFLKPTAESGECPLITTGSSRNSSSFSSSSEYPYPDPRCSNLTISTKA